MTCGGLAPLSWAPRQWDLTSGDCQQHWVCFRRDRKYWWTNICWQQLMLLAAIEAKYGEVLLAVVHCIAFLRPSAWGCLPLLPSPCWYSTWQLYPSVYFSTQGSSDVGLTVIRSVIESWYRETIHKRIWGSSSTTIPAAQLCSIHLSILHLTMVNQIADFHD